MGGWEDIVGAARDLETVELTYTKKNGEVVIHEVEPYSLRGDKFFGYRTDVGEIRSFSIGNINEVRRTGNKFSPRWTVEL